MAKEITGAHCQQCGNTDPEEVDPFNSELDGYSGCCNERIVTTCDVNSGDRDDYRDCYHK